MSKRFLKHAVILLVVLVVCWVLISPAVDLEPVTLRSFMFVAVFVFLLGCLKVFGLFPRLAVQLLSLEAIESAARPPRSPNDARVSCVRLC